MPTVTPIRRASPGIPSPLRGQALEQPALHGQPLVEGLVADRVEHDGDVAVGDAADRALAPLGVADALADVEGGVQLGGGVR
jgi:hypothetical protein